MVNPLSFIIEKIKNKDTEFENIFVALDDKDRIISIADNIESVKLDCITFNKNRNKYNAKIYKIEDIDLMRIIKKILDT